MEVDEGGSSSVVHCSTIVGGTTGSVAAGIVGVSGTGSLGTVEIDIRDSLGRPSSVVPTIVGGETSSDQSFHNLSCSISLLAAQIASNFIPE